MIEGLSVICLIRRKIRNQSNLYPCRSIKADTCMQEMRKGITARIVQTPTFGNHEVFLIR